jgi:DNA-binding CsgD family transcriptional regulator
MTSRMLFFRHVYSLLLLSIIVVPSIAMDRYPVSTMDNGMVKRMGMSHPLLLGRRKSYQNPSVSLMSSSSTSSLTSRRIMSPLQNSGSQTTMTPRQMEIFKYVLQKHMLDLKTNDESLIQLFIIIDLYFLS